MRGVYRGRWRKIKEIILHDDRRNERSTDGRGHKIDDGGRGVEMSY